MRNQSFKNIEQFEVRIRAGFQWSNETTVTRHLVKVEYRITANIVEAFPTSLSPIEIHIRHAIWSLGVILRYAKKILQW